MKISQIRLKQFKLFDNLKIELKPLTILTGANSSGKSTVLNALAGISQTITPHFFPFEFIPNGSNCSLGSYSDIINRHNTKKSFEIGLTICHNKINILLDAGYRYSPRGDHFLLHNMLYKKNEDSLDIKWLGSEKGYKCQCKNISLMKMANDKDIKKFLGALEDLAGRESLKTKEESIIKRHIRSIINPHKTSTIRFPSHISARDIPQKIRAEPTASYVLNDLQQNINIFQKNIAYVGPIRAIPLRYYVPDQPNIKIDPRGENCVQLLHDWQKHDTNRFIEVGLLLQKLELLKNIKTKSSTDDILKMIIQPFGHHESSNLADVGFGVSQALPMVVADVSLPYESVLLINQPEVHLHPTGQAQLANYFIDRLKSRQYIIETHSEYLINRLRLLTQNGKVDPKDISIIFFTPDLEKKSLIKTYSIQINKDGSLKDAPKQFFQTYYSDSFELAMGGNIK